MNRDLSYDEAVANTEQVLVQGRSWKADVFITRCRGQRFLVKDFGKKKWFERAVIGRLIVGRELRAYRALTGVPGLPSQAVRLAPFAIAIEYLEGKDLGRIDHRELGPGVVRQLEDVVEELHERGWVHLDLQRRTNIMLVDNRVFVIDLASAAHPGGVPLFGRCLTALLGLADRLALIKMKSIYAPELLTAKEKKVIKVRNMLMPTKW